MTTVPGEAVPSRRSSTAQAENKDLEAVYTTTIEWDQGVSTLQVFSDQHLDQGGFGAVFKGSIVGVRGERSVVAVKVVNGLDADQQRLLERELKMWKALNHVNILPLYGISGSLGVKQVGIVSPFAAHSNLKNYLLNDPTIDRMPLLLEIAEAVRYLHEDAKVVHGDLKCSNVLISDEGRPMISDFGLSTVVDKGATITATMIRRLSTVAFAAPELLGDRAYQNTFISAVASPFVRPKLRSKTTFSDVFARQEADSM